MYVEGIQTLQEGSSLPKVGERAENGNKKGSVGAGVAGVDWIRLLVSCANGGEQEGGWRGEGSEGLKGN